MTRPESPAGERAPPRRFGRPSKAEADAVSRDVLAAALAEFRRLGFAAATIEGIAAAANVSRAAIYRRFADKQALFASIAESQMAATAAQISVMLKTSPDPLSALRTTVRAYVGHLLSPVALDLQRIVIAESAAFPGLSERRTSPLPDSLKRPLDCMVALAQARGQIRHGPPASWRDVLLRLVAEGLCWQALVGGFSPSEAEADADFERMWPLFLVLAGTVTAQQPGAPPPADVQAEPQ